MLGRKSKEKAEKKSKPIRTSIWRSPSVSRAPTPTIAPTLSRASSPAIEPTPTIAPSVSIPRRHKKIIPSSGEIINKSVLIPPAEKKEIPPAEKKTLTEEIFPDEKISPKFLGYKQKPPTVVKSLQHYINEEFSLLNG
ncbi:MAG: hypothetical protein AB7U45_03870, partial [Desulfamplus sp.]